MVRESDISRHLPLSQRAYAEEASVTGDRRSQWSAVIEQARSLTDGASGWAEYAREARLTDPDTDRARTSKELVDSVRALLALADRVGVEPAIAPETLAIVSFHAAGTTPFDRRAVIRGHTVRASDADWQFGHGPALEGTALGIARFLLGLSDTPPRRTS